MVTIEIKGRIGKTVTRNFIVRMLRLIGIDAEHGVSADSPTDYIKFNLNESQIKTLWEFDK